MKKRLPTFLSAYLGVLIGMLIFWGLLSATAVEFVIPQQAQMLSLHSILVVWALGWVGVLLGERAGFAPLVSAGISNRQRVLIPALIGMGIGFLAVLMDLIQPLGGAIQIKFPVSLLVYPLGGVLEEIIFRLFLTTLLVWLISNVLLRRRWQGQVFWVVAVLVALLYTVVAQLGAYQALETITPLLALRFLVVVGVFSVIAAYLYRKYGFLAAIAARLGQYLIWHIIWGAAIGK
jgi:hypothetical protein